MKWIQRNSGRKLAAWLSGWGLAAALVPMAAEAQERPMVAVKTASGCLVMLDAESEAFYARGDLKRDSLTWSGACLAGYAHGRGTLTDVTGGDPKTTMATQTHMERGRPFGWFSFEGSSTTPGASSRWTSFGFQMDDRSATFNNLGFRASPRLLANPEGGMPERYEGPLMVNARIGTSAAGFVHVTQRSCLFIKGGPPSDCTWTSSYDVYLVLQQPPGTTRADQHKELPCPRPREIASCSEVLRTALPSYMAAVESLVRDAQPMLLQRMRGLATAQAEQAQRQRDAQQSFEATLAAAPVGELFALADELRSRNELARAREVLRTLMSRFPDHKLAVDSARLLEAMPRSTP